MSGAPHPTVFYVNVDFPPMSGAGVWRALGFARHLPTHGYDVRVFCADLGGHWTRHDASLLEQMPPTVSVWRRRSLLLHDLRVALGRRRESASRPRMRRLWSAIDRWLQAVYPDAYAVWTWQAIWAALREARRARPRCVITSGPPHVSHLVGLTLQMLLGIPWVADFRDPWMDDDVHRQKGSYQEWLFARLERAVFRRADAFVSISPRLQRHFADRVRAAGGRGAVHLIPNGHEVGELPVPAPRYGPAKARLHVHFNGTLQAASRCHSLLDALSALQKSGFPASRMPLVTFPGWDEAYGGEVAARALGDVVHDVGAQAHLLNLQWSASADVLLVLAVNRMPLSVGVTPAKLYESMALGRPILVLCPRGSDAEDLLRDHARAYFADVDDVPAIQRALLDLVQRRECGELDGARPAPSAAAMSRQARTKALAAIIDALPERSGQTTAPQSAAQPIREPREALPPEA